MVALRVSKFLSGVPLVALVFVCSRAVYIGLLGVRFGVEPLSNYIQYLDPELLRHDLLRSVFYLHFQPPLFNLFLGGVLKLFPEQYPLAFQVIYLAMGLALSVVLYLLLKKMGVGRTLATVLAAGHAAIPSTIIHENWLFYSYPVALGVCASAYFLACFLERYQLRYGLLFFFTLVVLSGLHAMYGLAWTLFVFGMLVLICKGQRVAVLRSGAVPVALVVGLAVKHYVLFGTLTVGSSYLGSNLAMRIIKQGDMPQSVQDELKESGDVPPYFFHSPLYDLSFFRTYFPESAPTGIPALDQERKSNGEPNYNHRDYPAIEDSYLRGAWNAIKKHPECYGRSFGSTIGYFAPASEGLVATQSAGAPFATLLRCWHRLACLQFYEYCPGVTLLVTLPVLLGFGVWRTWRGWRTRARDPRSITIAFMTFGILYPLALTAFLICGDWYRVTCGDWNRYRFGVDAFYLVFLGLLITACLPRKAGPP